MCHPEAGGACRRISSPAAPRSREALRAPASFDGRRLLAGRRADAAAVAGLLILVCLFNPGLAFEGKVLGGYDAFVYFYPLRAYFAQAVAEGRIPLWNPHSFLGVPFLANPQTAIFYPGTWLFALLDVPRAYALNYLGHLFVSAVGLYALARWSLGLGPLGSALGGAAFAFSGFMNGQAGHINQVSVAAWLPVAALALDLALRGGRPVARAASRADEPARLAAPRDGRLVALAALVAVVALQIMAGHPQEVYMTLVALGFLVIWRRAELGIRPLARGVLLLGAATALALGLCAIQLLPSAELSGQSIRSGGLSYQIASFEALPWPLLLPALFPGFWSHLPTTEFFGHVGTILLAIGWAGLTFGAARPALLGALYGALGLLLAVGDATSLYRLLFDWAPGFSSFRVPARWLLVSTFGLSVLAAVGADWLAARRVSGIGALRDAARGAGRARLLLFGAGVPLGLLSLVVLGQRQSGWLLLTWGLLVGLGAVLMLVSVWWSRARIPALTMLLLAGLGEAWLAGAGLEHRNPIPNIAYGRPDEATEELFARLAEGGAFRSLSIATAEYVHRDTPAIDERYTDLPKLARDNLLVAKKWNDTLWPNVPLVYGIPSADGYDGGVLPLGRYVQLTSAMLGADRARPDGVLASRLDVLPEARWLDLLGVRYVLASKAKDATREVIYLDRAVSVALQPGERLDLGSLPLGEFTRLVLLSSYAGQAGTGTEVARLELAAGDGRVAQIPLRDGLETAAGSAEDRADDELEHVPPWSPRPPDQRTDWLAEIPFGRQPVLRMSVVNVDPEATFHVRALNLIDDVREAAFPVTPDERIDRTDYFDVKLYDRRDALPRAYVVGSARAVDDTEALRVLADSSFDPSRLVLVAPSSDQDTGDAAVGAGRVGTASFEWNGAEQVRLNVRAESSGYLVLSDTWYPGWQATVDGEPTPILRANVLFRAVRVATGDHVIEFRYEPRSFQLGAAISAASLLLIVVLLVGARWAQRSTGAAVPLSGVRERGPGGEGLPGGLP